MEKKEALHGLNCPRCGGMVPVPEGQAIVRCPFCDLRSFVRGERGLLRYQVAKRIEQPQALEALRRFLSRNLAIARDAGRNSQLHESFLVYLPFWTAWARVAGWAFGEKKVSSGKSSHYEPREVRVVQEMTWNGAACDVGEFGVNQAPLANQEMGAFNPESLHATGLVFEPVGSFGLAKEAAQKQFQEQIRRRVGLDRLSQLFVRFFRMRFGLVYYPLWVMRYLYRGRAFQVVVDAYSGQVLYGKAPGNTFYRAARLVVGMAIGAFVAIDIPAFILSAMKDSSNNGGVGFALGLFIAGIALMFGSYRSFRYGEQFEYRQGKSIAAGVFENPLDVLNNMQSINARDVEEWINRLSSSH